MIFRACCKYRTWWLLLSVSVVSKAAHIWGVEPVFEAQTIDNRVQIGYGVAIADVDGDGTPDILLADQKQFVWYRNGDWKKFVLAENLTPLDNVCLAARDLNGDGQAEIAVGANWNPADTEHSGSVHYLLPPGDRTQRWHAIALHHEPTVHRMHWLKLCEGQFTLVVSPLHGRGNRNGEGAGVRLLAYAIPDDVQQPWPITLLDDTMHMTHNLDPCQWYADTPAEELLYIGREGAMVLYWQDGHWYKNVLPRIHGGGEIRLVVLADGRYAVATIEPMHGDQLVLYVTNHRGVKATNETHTEDAFEIVDRVVLDADYNGGHAIAVGDLLASAGQEIVAGWRLPNRHQQVGLRIYWPTDPTARQWQWKWIDENGMATEDARVADLNGDGRLDIVAAGRATKNLKIYWNRTAVPK